MKRLTILVVTLLASLSLAACGEYMNKKTPEKGTQVHTTTTTTTTEQDKMHPTHEVKPETNTNTHSDTKTTTTPVTH